MTVAERTQRIDEAAPLITADVFERGSGVPAALQRLGALVTVEPLTAGDYRVGGGVLIERKTVADLHDVYGVGARKAADFGDAFLDAIRTFQRPD